MKIYNIVICGTILLLSSLDLAAQGTVGQFSRFRVLLTNGDRVEGKNGILTSSELKGVSKAGNQLNIPSDKIRTLDCQAGTNAFKYGTYGALFGLGLGSSLVAQSGHGDNINAGEALTIITGCTVGGGLIGWIIGASSPKWERVLMNFSFRVEPQTNCKICSVNISLSGLFKNKL